jgi:hypothetical protein
MQAIKGECHQRAVTSGDRNNISLQIQIIILGIFQMLCCDEFESISETIGESTYY